MQRRGHTRLMRKHYAHMSCDGHYRLSYLRNTSLAETINYRKITNPPISRSPLSIEARNEENRATRCTTREGRRGRVSQNVADFLSSTLPNNLYAHEYFRISSAFHILMFQSHDSSLLRCSAGGNIIGTRKIQEEFAKCARVIVGYSSVDRRRSKAAELTLGR